MSSPRLNNIILVGYILAYSTILLLDVRGTGAAWACILRTFTIVIGFSLSFGALFAKTWRVYKIFTAGHRVLSTRMLRDCSLFVIVSVLVLINSLLLVGWMVISPQTPTMANISITPADEQQDVQYINQFQRCDSKYRLHFTCALLAIQSLVILLGTFLAIQTRKVSCPELNDSKWIAMCIYNVAVLCPVAVVVVMATEDKPQMNYALEVAMLLLITTMTQCLIFVPKIVSYRKHNRYQTSDVNITLKLNEVNNIFSLFQLGRKLSKTTGSDTTIKPEESSVCCEASQQTDEFDVSSLTRCICGSVKLSRNRTTSFYLGPEDDAEISSNKDSPRRMSEVKDQQCDMPDTDPESSQDCGPPEVFIIYNGSMRRSSSEPSFCMKTELKQIPFAKVPVSEQASYRSNITEPVPEIEGIEGMTGVHGRCKSRHCSTKSAYKNSRARRKGTQFRSSSPRQMVTGLTDDLPKYGHSLVVPGTREERDSVWHSRGTVKIKADVKVSSRLGLKASWKEGRSANVNKAHHVFELLNRLRGAMDGEPPDANG